MLYAISAILLCHIGLSIFFYFCITKQNEYMRKDSQASYLRMLTQIHQVMEHLCHIRTDGKETDKLLDSMHVNIKELKNKVQPQITLPANITYMVDTQANIYDTFKYFDKRLELIEQYIMNIK